MLDQERDERGLRRGLTPFRIAGLYLLVSVVWIVGTDAAVRDFTGASFQSYLAQMTKGLAFVSGSSVLLYALMRRMTERRARAERALEQSASLLRNLSHQTPGVIYQYQLFPDGRSCFPYASEGIREVYEVAPEDVRVSADAVFAVLHPGDVDRIVESINRSAATLTPWVCEYRVRLTRRGERWLEGRATPVRMPDGSTLWHGHIWDVTERRAAEDALRRSAATFRTLVEHAPEAIVIMALEEGRFVEANQNAERLLGLSRETLLSIGPAQVSPEFQPDGRRSQQAAMEWIARAAKGESPVFEWVHRHADGSDVMCEVRLVRLPSERGMLIRGSMTDIRERKAAERRQALMVQELNHRVKNNLAAVLSIADRSFEGVGPEHAEALRGVKQAFAGRVRALAGLHNLLSAQKWEGVRLRALLEQTLGAFSGGAPGSPRVVAQGPDALLSPRAASALCMTLHELATNAAKYGGLSRPGGGVALRWSIDDAKPAPSLRMTWEEHGAPLPGAPDRRGFGLSLIEEALRYEVNGSASITFGPGGARCEIVAPLAERPIALAQPIRPTDGAAPAAP